MEKQTVANGGVQYEPQIVYQDLDGDAAPYNDGGEITAYAGRYDIKSGTTSDGLMLENESAYVSNGGIVSRTTVNSGGRLNILNGGTANATEVNSSGRINISRGGAAEDTTVNKGGSAAVSSGGSAGNTTVNPGGKFSVYEGGSAGGVTVSSGGSVSLSSKGVINSIAIGSNGNLSVFSGGTATDIKASAGAKYFFAVASNTLVKGTYAGAAFEMKDAKLSGFTVSSGGSVTVSSGGLAEQTAIKKGGVMCVSKGGTAEKTAVEGGSVSVGGGAQANDTSIIGGSMYITGGNGNGTDVTNGRIDVYGGSVSGTTLNGGADLYLFWDALADDTTVNSGGVVHIASDGSAHRTTVNDGGAILISEDASATDLTVKAGGCIGGFSFLGDQFFARVDGTAVISDEVFISGYGLNVLSGGSVSGVSVHSGGIMVVSGGTAKNTVVEAWGSMCVSGGVAENTVVTGNGYLEITSGAVLRGTLSADRDVVVYAYQGSVIDFTVAGRSVSSGYLISSLSMIAGAPSYTVTVSPDQDFGEYKLAQGADYFTATVSIGDENGRYGLATVNGDDLYHNGKYYSLDQRGGSLLLTITDVDQILNDQQVIYPDTKDLTNKSVTVTILYAENSRSKQYRIGETGAWKNYTSSFTVDSNVTVYSRAEDRDGNEITGELVIDNIDKNAPTAAGAFSEKVSGYKAELTWAESTDDKSGVKGYYIRYGSASALSGDGEFVEAGSFELTDLDVGKYCYQVRTVDHAGNFSKWSSVRSFRIDSVTLQDMQSDSSGISWEPVPGARGYIVEYSNDDFSHVISLETASNRIDTFALPAGTYQWKVRAVNDSQYTEGKEIVIQQNAEDVAVFVSDNDGSPDLFFGRASEKWTANYFAQHQGSCGEWQGTRERIELIGKNRIADVFEGSDDANILVLTDDAGGDALFVDDIYTALGEEARLSQIDEIRAGAGDDIVDMTGQRYEYVGGGVTIRGGAGNDTIWANKGSNILFGDGGSDRIIGGSGDDVIAGGSGDDVLHGGGGNDIFTFGGSWGCDTVEQLEGGSVILWFEKGSESCWNSSTMTYTDGACSVTVSGVTEVTLKFGGDISTLPAGVFADGSSENVFEENKGMLA